ncbi:MAG TPA: glutamate ABC transporter substrate-binding protein [Pseudonocardia sp.]|nr:glutamate ABC transporter substrate-binding protein [Pseudonocardia sp.]
MRLTHTFRLAAVAAALALAATACGGGGESQLGADAPAPSVAEDVTFEAGTTMAALAEADAIRVGTKFDQPLFGATGLSDQPEGFDVEIAKIIAGKLGIEPDKITFSEAPSAIREEVLEQDRVDMVVATYTINDRRKERISFAGPYYVAGQDLMVAADNTTITGPDALRGANARVCSVAGSTPSETIKEYVDEASLTLFDVYSKCADALRTGQVDAVTTDNVILLGLIDQSQGAFKLVGQPFTEEPYGIGIKKGDVAFCEFINQTLQDAVADGSYQAAWEATAGKVAPEAPTLPPAGACS